MKPFCIHHSDPVELEDGYQVLPCKLRHKVCPFKLKGGVEFCPDIQPLPFRHWPFKLHDFDAREEGECEDGKCKL